ncbi:ABC transporter substrate-binding protein [Roseobacter sp. HKCCD9010]|uniref:heme/hemin ABC transporter substrate-binding protein n=1 Tax=unclassified Roseobacter TaxID=196798 RepID=UPI001491305E|nr:MULTISPECIES: ABC transporter substrate-binding protein [unclassified Roseobacter]MBF9052463.1 ABC transporter substrate-binding protein [Rhodobacterales bacterium HKCCD4356]NNV14230.1 ABC transporter substrate-binding protein [Roseobacter sp. HKCCD7357]NNV18655.1 ABC transporter substrate-binding protein [Roseobacter sp. HKCCD8768]NNV28107.1 ABC transporter substrate-binding protein [Roseobacter sp. HKCCD8192]NNV32389.1 ABC transporter substrate-binding protein [Roseobacter sp. HKCCD9061]
MIRRGPLKRLTPSSLALIMIFGLLLAFIFGPARAQNEGPRVVAVGGSITEIIYELEMEHLLVARDTTSSWPPEVAVLPDVGYIRALSPEGVLSVRPDLIIAEEGAGPPESIEVLANAEIEFVEVPETFDANGVRSKILAVADALGVPEEGVALADRIEAELAQAVAAISDDAPRVLFILSMQDGRVMASGTGTAASGIIEMSGGQNAIDAFEGYRQLTDEAVLSAAPDVILMMDRGGDHSAANADLFAHPALGLTPAAQNERVVRINGLLLLGFGPRTPMAVGQLSEALGTVGG